MVGKTYIFKENIGSILKGAIFTVKAVKPTFPPIAEIVFIKCNGLDYSLYFCERNGLLRVDTINQLCEPHELKKQIYTPRPKSW